MLHGWLGTMVVVAMLLGTAAPAEARPISRTVTWTSDGVTFEGALVFDPALLRRAKGKLPGVLVVHQWMGPTANETLRATMLAELGYAAFVADVYGKDVRPTDQAGAMAAAGGLKGDRPLLRKRVAAALQAMRGEKEVDAARVAAIGYCFGGTAVLELAKSGADVRGVVSFHGGLDAPAAPAGETPPAITAKVLVLHGAADPFVKAPDIQAFVAELDLRQVDWQMVSYSGAVHAFTQKEAGDDPKKGAAYDERADRRSWAALQTFLGEVLGR